MSTSVLDDLPVASDDRQGRAPTVAMPDPGTSRRDLLRYTVGGATFVGLFGLSMFRSARRAGAENPPWDEWESCGGYDPGEPICGNEMCVGASAEYMGRLFCTTDCADVDANNWYNWHKNRADPEAGYEWRDYPGDICWAGQSTPRDAWWWGIPNCNNCAPIVYRCHDGQKRDDPTSNTWIFTICQGTVSCSGLVPTCP